MTKGKAKPDKVPTLEWIVGGLGLAIILFILGVIGWQAVTGQDDPVPLLSARIASVSTAGTDQVATVTVTNASSRTAASVHVEGIVGKGSPDEQISSATIDYVAGHGEASAALIFSAGSSAGPPSVRVTGYEHP